jgi:acyl-ACP thioesterase
VAAEDVADAGLDDEDGVWLLRRAAYEVRRWPRLYEDLEVTTWATGARGAVAERHTTIGDADVHGNALWACVEKRSSRPRRLSARFEEAYSSSIAGRRVSSRPLHGDPPLDSPTRPFVLRYSDFDRVGHVNNAVYLEALEVEVEWRGGLTREHAVDLALSDGAMWFLQGGRVAASIRYEPIID